MLTFSILILLLINTSLYYLQSKWKKLSSDHHYHMGLISEIKKNNHRFIIKNQLLIAEKNFAYPQFVHFVLSFIPEKYITTIEKVFGIIVSNLCLGLFCIISINIRLNIQSSLPLSLWMIATGALYITYPFHWAIWNSKNSGISARGVGILLVYCFQLFSLLYLNESNWLLIMVLSFVSFIIIVSSQFAFQYLLLSSLFYFLFFRNYMFLLFPLIGLLIFFLVSPKVALSFVKGQFWHKYIYSKYLANVFILKKRYSIWRDFVFDFYVKLKRDGIKSFLLYVYSNSLFSIIFLMPLNLLVLWQLVSQFSVISEIGSSYVLSSISLVLISYILFFITSFRKTRFLGEPERYVEFSIPFQIVLFLYFYNSLSHYCFIVCYSILLVIIQFVLKKLMRIESKKEPIIKMRYFISTKCDNNCCFFSNNEQISKLFLSLNLKTVKPNLTSFYTGPYSFTEIFPEEYPVVEDSTIEGLIKYYEVDYAVFDNSIVKNKSVVDEIKNEGNKIYADGTLELFCFNVKKEASLS